MTTDLARIQDDRLPEINGNGLVYAGLTPGVGGMQAIYRFPNGYGASIIRHGGSNGASAGLWELVVLRIQGGTMWQWSIDYSTPVTDDVIGGLAPTDVDSLLDHIAALPPAQGAITG